MASPVTDMTSAVIGGSVTGAITLSLVMLLVWRIKVYRAANTTRTLLSYFR